MGILSGTKVVDLTRHMAGPLCTQMLGDMGADVVKVESPEGEWGRIRPINDLWVDDLNTSFLSLNRNKRSVTLNLKSDEGRASLYDLVRDSDVVAHNFRPDAAERLKVDYEAIAGVKPDIVYCAISGYGSTGPSANRAGQDLLLQSYTGIPWNAGRAQDPPVPAGCFVADATTAYMATIGILGALLHRERTGRGQSVETDLLSSCFNIQIQELTTYLNTGWSPDRTHERLAHRMANPPYGIHQTADGWIALAMIPFDILADALECEELRQYAWDDGYKHPDHIFRLVAEKLKERTTAEWIEHFDRSNVWSGPVNTYEMLATDPNVLANGLIQEVEDPERGTIKYVGFPIRFSETPAQITRNPPRLGEHNDEILGQSTTSDG
jgi:crotonobetainyl-CoA:carnitine CoA-transferase CaiB-like acyl-CoA transferase